MLQQIIGTLGQIATWVTVLLVFLTLREMEKQRKASQKPELIIPKVLISGYANNREGMSIASTWRSDNPEINKEETSPIFTIYNIGAGAAKDIKIQWSFDINNIVKLIQDYCDNNSIPIIVSNNKEFLNIEYDHQELVLNNDTYSNFKYAYLMPSSVTSQGLRSFLPVTFLHLASIIGYLRLHKLNQDNENDSTMPLLAFLDLNSLRLDLSYEDIGGEKYIKKFEIKSHFTLIASTLPEIIKEPSSMARVFRGGIEFKEISGIRQYL